MRNKNIIDDDNLTQMALYGGGAIIRRRGADLTLRQLIVLFACAAIEPNQSARNLATLLLVEGRAIRHAIGRLKQLGLIEEASDPGGRQGATFVATENGDKIARWIAYGDHEYRSPLISACYLPRREEAENMAAEQVSPRWRVRRADRARRRVMQAATDIGLGMTEGAIDATMHV
jgi:DNA-binding MarR family transcriptional regulator